MSQHTESILDRIREIYYSLGAAEQKVATFSLENFERVQFMSISELADAAGVGDATVTRFCRRLSLSGFAAFKLELAKCTSQSGGSTAEKDTEGDIKAAAKKEALLAIESTLEAVDSHRLSLAVDMMEGAGRVLCAGMGGGMVSAAECALRFFLVDPKFIALPDSHLQTSTLATMTENDLLIFFSYSGATVEGTELIKLAKARKVKTLLITRFARSPSASCADLVLTCGSNEGPYQMGSAPARIAQTLVIDLLFREYYRRNREKAEKNIGAVADALSNRHA